MVDIKLSVADIIAEFLAVCREHSGYLALLAAVIAGSYIALDFVSDGMGGSAASLVVSIFVQFLAVERLLADRLPNGKAPHRRYGAIFASALLGGLGIVVGFIVFVVPGLLLMAAWSASTPFIVVEGMGGPQALAASWRATENSRVALTLVAAIGFVAVIAAVALLYAAAYFGPAHFTDYAAPSGTSIAEIVIGNVIGTVISIAGWIFGVAVYRLVRPMVAGFDQVFA